VSDGLRRFQVLHPHTCTPVLILRPTPIGENAWGKLDCLRDTILRPLIPIVSGESLSKALHGDSLPLFREIGPEPKYRLAKVTGMHCGLIKRCVLADNSCYPHKKVPLCYQAPLEEEFLWAANQVILAWRENRYVLVADGGEFSLSRRPDELF
jgi:hypothetical protein